MSFANKARKIIAEMKEKDSYERNERNERSPSPLPFFEADGGLVIPFNAENKYFYWQEGGQSISTTEEEVRIWLH